MKFRVERRSIVVEPETEADAAYIEDTLGLKHEGDLVPLMRDDFKGRLLRLRTPPIGDAPKLVSEDFAKKQAQEIAARTEGMSRLDADLKEMTRLWETTLEDNIALTTERDQAHRDRDNLRAQVDAFSEFVKWAADHIVDVETKCPACGQQHVDEGPWYWRPHNNHLCVGCGNVWHVERDDQGIIARYTRGVAPAPPVPASTDDDMPFLPF